MSSPASGSFATPARTAARFRLVVFGDVIDDIVVIPSGPVRPDTDTPSLIRSLPGGSAANVAAWAASLGASVDFVGWVGEADVARHRRALEQHGVRAHLTGDPENGTGTIVAIVREQERDFLTQRGANAVTDPDAVTDELLGEAAVLHVTGFSVAAGVEEVAADQAVAASGPDPFAFTRLIARAVATGVRVSVDPGSVGFIADYGADRFLRRIDGASILLPSLDEGRLLTGYSAPRDVAAALGRRFPLVALTLGVDGVLVVEGGAEPVHVLAVPSDTVDPTGAGDAFCAGFLTTLASTGDAVLAATAGAELASRAVRALGGRPPV